jgi:2-oxo-3-hexenedioate decarboxylase
MLAAYDGRTLIEPITSGTPDFGVADAYDVLAEIERARTSAGWKPVGRKIGFTNRTIWGLYNVTGPFWARVWDRTCHRAPDGTATLDLAPFVQPRIETEVAFRLASAPPVTDDPEQILACVEWMAPSFEIVHCHFPEWRFSAPDCTADFGLHGALIVGRPVEVTAANRAQIAARLADFDVAVERDGTVAATGNGAHVLDSPARALGYLIETVAAQDGSAPLDAGEIITTGTLTDAVPVAAGETWTSDYTTLGLGGIRIEFR